VNPVNLNTNSGELTTIRLYGPLGAMFGRVHQMAVENAAEAVRALCSQLPGFERYLTESKDKGYGFAVFYGKNNLKEEDLKVPAFGEDIRIAPIILGSKSGGWFNVIVGVVLIVVGVVVNYFAPGAGAPFIKMGIGLVVGGVVQLLAPVPKGMGARDRPEDRPSYAFNGPINTQAQGNPVMVVYGEVISGSAVLSAGISAVDQAYIPRDDDRPGSGGGGGSPWSAPNFNN
jgi:predicted phage tail protein